jgi:hypothetical protein
MFNHAPKDYICPFCLLVKGIENELPLLHHTGGQTIMGIF